MLYRGLYHGSLVSSAMKISTFMNARAFLYHVMIFFSSNIFIYCCYFGVAMVTITINDFILLNNHLMTAIDLCKSFNSLNIIVSQSLASISRAGVALINIL